MRSIAHQSDEELGGSLSVLVRQKRDHQDLDTLLDELLATAGEEQQGVLNRVCRLAFAHAFAEEAVLWPAIRRALPDGEQLTLVVEQEHQEINELVVRLEEIPLDDPERGPVVTRVVDLLRQDVRDEEDELFPRLRASLDDAQLRRLGRKWSLVRRTAPTRPHAIVSRRPPGNVLAALPLSVIDRTRDLLDRPGRNAPGGVTAARRLASRNLARAARRVEGLRVNRSGERPETRNVGAETT